MKPQYYLAVRGCSMGVQQRSLLAVYKKEKRIEFHRGSTEDRFEVGEDGKPLCATERGGLEYNIFGPLDDTQVDELIEQNIWGDFTKTQRLTSLRTFTSVFGGKY